MGKIKLDFTPFTRRDPVTGELQTLIRSGDSRQTSPRLKEFQRCVADGMRGFSASGGTSRERSMSIRNQLSSVAKQCQRGGGS